MEGQGEESAGSHSKCPTVARVSVNLDAEELLESEHKPDWDQIFF